MDILIEAGHGGRDPGAVNGTRRESDDVLRMALAVGRRLEAQGQSVRYTRTADTTVSLDQVARLARDNDFTLSIHRNSVANPAATGIEVLHRHTNSRAAADIVLQELLKVAPAANRGVKQFNYLGFNQVSRPAALAELLFISNPADNRLFDDHFDAYALALAQGVIKALGLKWKESEEVGITQTEININGQIRTVDRILVDGFNYIKVRDLESKHIEVKFDETLKIPVITTTCSR